MAIEQLSGQFSITVDGSDIVVKLPALAVRGKNLALADVGEYLGERIQLVVDNLKGSESPKLRARIDELQKKLAAHEEAVASAEHRENSLKAEVQQAKAAEVEAKKKASHVPAGFRDASQSTKPKRKVVPKKASAAE